MRPQPGPKISQFLVDEGGGGPQGFQVHGCEPSEFSDVLSLLELVWEPEPLRKHCSPTLPSRHLGSLSLAERRCG